MKRKETYSQKHSWDHKKAAEEERKKDAWKKYEMHLRRARSGYSELDLDEYLSGN